VVDVDDDDEVVVVCSVEVVDVVVLLVSVDEELEVVSVGVLEVVVPPAVAEGKMSVMLSCWPTTPAKKARQKMKKERPISRMIDGCRSVWLEQPDKSG
jgi:hypothetical protein